MVLDSFILRLFLLLFFKFKLAVDNKWVFLLFQRAFFNASWLFSTLRAESPLFRGKVKGDSARR